MPEKNVAGMISRSVSGGDNGVTAFPLLYGLASAADSIPPWWSPQRDYALEDLVRSNDYLSGAVFTFSAKMSAIPFRIIPDKITDKKQRRDAAYYEWVLRDMSNFGRGWVHFFSQFVRELVEKDNGAFAEIIGGGPKDGPIKGKRLGVAVLDSHRCQRTGDPVFPVLYQSDDGKLHKLHYTRVIFTAQMPSARKEMYGVGLSAVSRCINIAQTLSGLINLKLEKMGSRPQRGILLTRGGLDPTDVQTAFEAAEARMDAMGLKNYSRITVVGSSTLRDAGIDLIELSKLPDGFDEQTSVTLGIAAIALAFGVDYRDLFPQMTGGASRADALLTHIKQRGKGPGQVLRVAENLFSSYFLPPYLRLRFDFQDDSQDRQRADIRKVRADRRAVDLMSGSVDERTLREQMLAEQEITEEQFVAMELRSGRLPDGKDILTLFYDPEYADLLDLGVETPTASYHDAEMMCYLIDDALARVYEGAGGKGDQRHAFAEYALKTLRKQFEGSGQEQAAAPQQPRRRATEPAHKPDGRVRGGGEIPQNGYYSGEENRQDNLAPGRDDGDGN